MSWDVLFFASPTEPPAAADLDEDWNGGQLGTLAQVRQIIDDVCPGTDWSDPAWGLHTRDKLHMEFNIGEDDPCTSFAVHVRGWGDPLGTIRVLAATPGWYALDSVQNQWLHLVDNPAAGWRTFSAFRDQLFAPPPPLWRRLAARLMRR